MAWATSTYSSLCRMKRNITFDETKGKINQQYVQFILKSILNIEIVDNRDFMKQVLANIRKV